MSNPPSGFPMPGNPPVGRPGGAYYGTPPRSGGNDGCLKALGITCLTLLVLGIIAIHPQSDPIDVMGQVAKGLAPTIVGVFAFLKSQEVKAVSESTHVAVNSRLDAWMEANTQISKAVGVVQGIAEEKARALESEPPAPKQNQ